MTGSSQLSTAFANHVSQLATIASTLSDCVVKVNTMALKTNSQFATEASKLGLSITEMGQRKVSAIDAIIIKVSDVAAKYIATTSKLTLELVNSIISQSKAFLGLYTIRFQYETPSAVAVDLSTQFLNGLQKSDERLNSLDKSTKEMDAYIDKYAEVMNTAGQNGGMGKEQKLAFEALENGIFANAMEYFAVPSFHPTNIQSYTSADLLLADLYSKNEFACIAWSSVLPNSSHSCTSVALSDQKSPDEISDMAKHAQETLQEVISSSFDEASEQGFMSKLELAGKQCLDAIMGLNMEGSFVDPSNASYLVVFNQLRDYLIDQGCEFLNDAIQSKIAETKQKILDAGEVIKSKSMDQVVIEVNDNDTQTLDLLLDEEADGERVGLYGLRFFGDVPEDPANSEGAEIDNGSAPSTPEVSVDDIKEAIEWKLPESTSNDSDPYDLPGGGWGLSDETWNTLLEGEQ